MKHWVILFVRTGAEEKAASALKEKLNAGEWLPFLPAKEAPRRTKGVIRRERRLLFPGYVFMKTAADADSIADKLKFVFTDNALRKDIYSILHYGENKNDVAVREREVLYYQRLFGADFFVRGSVGFIEGDMIRVTSGPLLGLESRIKRIDRHKREAVIEIEMMGAVRKVRVMLEVVEKRG